MCILVFLAKCRKYIPKVLNSIGAGQLPTHVLWGGRKIIFACQGLLQELYLINLMAYIYIYIRFCNAFNCIRSTQSVLMASILALSLLVLPLAFAAQVNQFFSVSLLHAFLTLFTKAPQFVPSSPGPLVPSKNLGGPSNGSLPPPSMVQGRYFDRFIQVIRN